MKIAYVTPYKSTDILSWSGLGFYIAQSLKEQAIEIKHIDSLREKYSVLFKAKKAFYLLLKKRYLLDREPVIIKDYANQVYKRLSQTNVDLVFSTGTIPIAYLDCQQPIVIWSDCTFAGMVDFYPYTSNLCQETLNHGNVMESFALQKCKLAIFASEWAAQTAIDHYKIDPIKVKVVPFGANIECHRSLNEIKMIIEKRPPNKCKLLFIGVDWFRKGGNIALEVAKALNKSGLPTELTIVGCKPIVKEPLPNFVKSLGFISKSSEEGKQKIADLLAESHFLILPSQSECFGVVFCEASSFGVPCLATQVGGIPTAVRDNFNGKLFALDANISEYCHYISDLFTHYSDYKKLALSAFDEYHSRLNWSVAGKTVKNLLMDILS